MKRSAYFPVKELAVILSVILLSFISKEDVAANSTGNEVFGIIRDNYTPFLSSAKQIVEFRYNEIDPDAVGLIDQAAGTIAVHVPFSQSVTSLVANFTLSPLATAYVAGVQQSSGVTANSFSNTVSYLVVAEDGSSRYYTVNIFHDQARKGKVLESFSLQGLTPPVQGVIDQVTHAITVTVPYSTNLGSLIANFTNSYLSTVKVGNTSQVSGVTFNDFSSGLVYTVYAEDVSTQTYTVTVIKNLISSAKQITDFRFNGLSADAVGTINEGAGTLSVTIPWGADITNLAASFSASAGSSVKVATVLQVSGISRHNFTSPVTYTVTAENGTTKDYIINVNKAAIATGNSILTFGFVNQFNPIYGTIDQTAKTIQLLVPFSQNLTALVPSFISSLSSSVLVGSTIQISGVTPNDFSSPLIYSCRSEDGSTELYSVTVSRIAASASKQLTDFRFNLPDYTAIGIIDQLSGTVVLHVPFGTDVTYLVGSFTTSPLAKVQVGGLLQVSGETPQNFYSPVAYHVIAEDNSDALYGIRVIVDLSSEKRLYSFAFNSLVPPVTGVINEDLKTVQVNVPFNTSRSNLIASFTQSAYASVWINTTEQFSGVTANNFTGSKVYTVKAQDNSLQDYSVNVSVDPASSLAQITDFRFNGFPSPAIGVIDHVGGTITVAIPYAASYLNLIASFSNSDFSTVKVGGTPQISGITPNSFTNPVTYQVTAQNGNTKNYIVTVVKAPASGEKAILSFNFEVQFEPDIIGTIDQVAKTIRLIVPLTQDVTNLIPTFTSSLLSGLLIGSAIQVSGVTPNDFTNPVNYLCRAEDGSTQIYRVTVIHGPASNLKEILSFRFNGLLAEAIGSVDPTYNTVTVHVPGETDVTKLAAIFVLSPFAIAKVGGATQISGVTQNDFSTQLQYTIIAENNSEKTYTVRVVIGLYVSKQMLSFGFPDIPEAVDGVIDESAKTIVVYVPFSISRQSLIATFNSSDRSTVWIGNNPQVSGLTANDFNSVKTYTVKAEDLTTSDYAVMVLKSPALNGDQILSFSFSGLIPPVGGIINQAARTITAELPFGTDVTSLVATFTNSLFAAVSVDAISQVSGFTRNDFTIPLIYRCTSESGLINEYTVTVNITPGSSEKDITYFAFEDLSPVCTGLINQADKTIILQVPIGTQVSYLRAYFVHSPGSSVSIASIGMQVSGENYNDFTDPVIYHVTADDGSTVDYTVTVSVIPDTLVPVVTNPAQMVTNSSGQFVVLQSNKATGKVYIIRGDAPQNTMTDLEQSVSAGLGRAAPVIQSNTEIMISTYALEQGIYYTYASDGAGNKSERGINSMSIIDVLAPDVFVQGQVISNGRDSYVNIRSSDNYGFVYLILEGIPTSTKQQLDAAVGGLKGQKSIVTTAYFDIPVSTYQLLPGNYRAFAVDLSGNISAQSLSRVEVTQASHLNSILAFSFPGFTPPAVGQIVGTAIFIQVPAGTPVTALVASFTLSTFANAFVGLVQQNSGESPNNFTNPVVYTIEAEDGSLMDYTVTVNFASGVNDQEWFSKVKTFPNPFSDELTIQLSQPASRIQIVNELGQTLIDLREPSDQLILIETGSWMKGIYLIRYYREDKCIGVQKVIRN